MHMVFTGNPGTAKTTVARLFARIMKDNGLLTKGDLYEVGRADLVGKYVGWTAKIVKEKFAQAKGGVLFIDEAYSLVDDKNGLFGDEAISTIVQEMENHREDTVVIFAGYPEKMEEFLHRNPGLRSRIAFHLPFADYSADELFRITELIAERSGMTLAPDVSDKLKPIIETATKTFGFGNGRFARNLVEKAKMKQASRLVSLGYDAVSEKDIPTLIAEDFEVPEIMTTTGEKRILGFSACNSGVAALAKAHEIVKVVRTSVSKRNNVVDFLYGRQPALLQTLLAKRVLSEVRRADFPPRRAVTLVGFRVAFVFVVASIRRLLMLGTVTAVGQLRTAGVAARLLWFLRHEFSPLGFVIEGTYFENPSMNTYFKK